MKYYLKLQSVRLFRWFQKIGTHPVLGAVLGVIFFVLLSNLLFLKIESASWIYSVLAVWVLLKLSDKNRNDQLRNIFSSREYSLLRLLENSIVALPFILYLLAEKEFLTTLILLATTIATAFFRTGQLWNRTIPTPFKKFPYEFIVGFRKTFWIIGIAYFLIFKALQVDNYNLGLVGLALIFLCSMTYFSKAEPKYFVWIYSYKTNGFLSKKIIMSVICVSVLSVLALIGLLIGFPKKWITTFIIYLIGYIFLSSMILAKYSSFPHEMNVTQGIFYAISLFFPPLLLITFWIFYSKSKKRLEPILKC